MWLPIHHCLSAKYFQQGHLSSCNLSPGDKFLLWVSQTLFLQARDPWGIYFLGIHSFGSVIVRVEHKRLVRQKRFCIPFLPVQGCPCLLLSLYMTVHFLWTLGRAFGMYEQTHSSISQWAKTAARQHRRSTEELLTLWGYHLPELCTVMCFCSVLSYDLLCLVTIKSSWNHYLIGTWHLEKPKSVLGYVSYVWL